MKQQLSPPEHCFVLSTKILLTVTLSKQQSSCRLSDVHPLAKLHAIINIVIDTQNQRSQTHRPLMFIKQTEPKTSDNRITPDSLQTQHKQISAADEEMQLVVRCE